MYMEHLAFVIRALLLIEQMSYIVHININQMPRKNILSAFKFKMAYECLIMIWYNSSVYGTFCQGVLCFIRIKNSWGYRSLTTFHHWELEGCYHCTKSLSQASSWFSLLNSVSALLVLSWWNWQDYEKLCLCHLKKYREAWAKCESDNALYDQFLT